MKHKTCYEAAIAGVSLAILVAYGVDISEEGLLQRFVDALEPLFEPIGFGDMFS